MLFLFQLIFLFMTADQPRQVLLFYKEDGEVLFQKQLSEFEKNESGYEGT